MYPAQVLEPGGHTAFRSHSNNSNMLIHPAQREAVLEPGGYTEFRSHSNRQILIHPAWGCRVSPSRFKTGELVCCPAALPRISSLLCCSASLILCSCAHLLLFSSRLWCAVLLLCFSVLCLPHLRAAHGDRQKERENEREREREREEERAVNEKGARCCLGLRLASW